MCRPMVGKSLGLAGILVVIVLAACAPTAQVTATGGPSIQEAQQEAYNGPKARIAVSRFTDKTGKGWWTGSIGDGMADMLATALFQTNRYIVLERQTLKDVLQEQDLAAAGRVRQETAAPIGEIEGAELLVTGAVTEFEPGARGGGAGLLGRLIPGADVVGAIAGAVKQAHIAIDLRLIDTRTSRIVAATSVEGKATDIAGLGALVGGSLAGALGGWSKTPMEKAIRVALGEAVKFVVSRTPSQYYHYTPGGGTTAAPAPSPAPAAPAASPPPDAPAPPTTPPAALPADVASAPSSAAPPVKALPEVVYVTAPAVNVREGAGETFKVLATVPKGTKLRVMGEKDEWYKVRLDDGREGWIANWLARPSLK